jgi:hypothetical protein
METANCNTFKLNYIILLTSMTFFLSAYKCLKKAGSNFCILHVVSKAITKLREQKSALEAVTAAVVALEVSTWNHT